MSLTTTSARLCPTTLRYETPDQGGAYCSGTAATEVLQSCCVQVKGKYDCMKNKCYMPIKVQPAWRECIKTEVFACTAASSAPPRTTKTQALTLVFGLAIALLGIAAGS